jgi:hypothetical protein
MDFDFDVLWKRVLIVTAILFEKCGLPLSY